MSDGIANFEKNCSFRNSKSEVAAYIAIGKFFKAPGIFGLLFRQDKLPLKLPRCLFSNQKGFGSRPRLIKFLGKKVKTESHKSRGVMPWVSLPNSYFSVEKSDYLGTQTKSLSAKNSCQSRSRSA